MDVVYWQIGVAAAVAVPTLFLGARTGLLVAIASSLLSAAMIDSVPLMTVQLCTIWLAYGSTVNLGRKKDQRATQRKAIDRLKASIDRSLEGYDNRVRANAQVAIEHSRHEIVRNKQHSSELFNAISGANSSVTIVSGWIRTWVVDRKLLGVMREALSRGVDIFISYGCLDDPESEDAGASVSRARSKLEKLAVLSARKRGWGRLVVHQSSTLEKALIKDTDYVICGSNSWLSNRKFRKSDQSIKIWDSDLAVQMTARYRQARYPTVA